MKQHLLSIPNRLDALQTVSSTLEELGEQWQLPMTFVLNINLVLEEIITNIIFYGFPQGGDHQIDIAMLYDREVFFLEVKDDGIAFNPLLKESPDLDANIEDRAIGGLGIHFVKSIMDKVTYERKANLNILRMEKSIQTAT